MSAHSDARLLSTAECERQILARAISRCGLGREPENLVLQALRNIRADIARVDEKVDSLRDRAGSWAVTVRANWRVVFRFEGGGAFDVDYEDYR